VSADDWGSERLEEAMRVLQGLLLSREPRQREAYRQRYVVDGSGSDDEIERARRLLGWLLDTLTSSSRPERWRQLAAMLDAARLEQPSARPLDHTAPLIKAVDITLPAATELRPETFSTSPPTVSMDGTFAIGEVSLDDLGLGDLGEDSVEDAATESARRAPGGTLMTGKSPESALDVEKYAILCAWTERHPERREALHAQYGITGENERAVLDREFEARFVRDPQLRAAFAQRLSLHLKWLGRG
jgi:hypothetical protein